MAYPNQKDSARYLIGKKNELEKKKSPGITREFRRNRAIFRLGLFFNSLFFPMSYRAESFWFGQPMHEACLAKPRRSWCLNKFLFDLILKSAVFFTLEQHLTEDVSHQKSGLAWAVVFSGSLGWAGLWLCLCCLWNNHFTLEQHSLHKIYFCNLLGSW